jgi:hypothetical protein
MILGALVTLCVTVIGGVVAYYLTKQKPAPAPTEKLVYQIEKPTTFETEATKRSFLTVRSGNLGNKTASEVRIGIQFGEGVLLLDKKITLSTEPVGTFEDRSSAKNRADLFVPTLIAGEIVAVTMMLDGCSQGVANRRGKKCEFFWKAWLLCERSGVGSSTERVGAPNHFDIHSDCHYYTDIPSWITFFEFPAENTSLYTYVPLCEQHRVPLYPSGINRGSETAFGKRDNDSWGQCNFARQLRFSAWPKRGSRIRRKAPSRSRLVGTPQTGECRRRVQQGCACILAAGFLNGGRTPIFCFQTFESGDWKVLWLERIYPKCCRAPSGGTRFSRVERQVFSQQ